MSVIPRRQAKSLTVNEPTTDARISAGGQAEGASVNRYQDALSNLEPQAKLNVDAYVKRVLKSVLEEIQKTTDSPHKPMLSDKGAVNKLLSGVISMDIRDSAGNTPLHVAVFRLSRFNPYARIVPGPLHALVASGADINAKNSVGETPLLLAVSRSSSTVSRTLLELGASAEESDLDGIRPLIKAVQQGSRTLAALLLDHGAFVGTIQVKQKPVTPLHEAARLKWETICQLVLRRGANVNARDSLEQTPLHKAVLEERLVVAGSLLSSGADVGAKDNMQRTALHYAVVWNSVPLVKLLLDHGASPDVVDKCGTSPRQAAARANVPGVMVMFD